MSDVSELCSQIKWTSKLEFHPMKTSSATDNWFLWSIFHLECFVFEFRFSSNKYQRLFRLSFFSNAYNIKFHLESFKTYSKLIINAHFYLLLVHKFEQVEKMSFIGPLEGENSPMFIVLKILQIECSLLSLLDCL